MFGWTIGLQQNIMINALKCGDASQMSSFYSEDRLMDANSMSERCISLDDEKQVRERRRCFASIKDSPTSGQDH